MSPEPFKEFSRFLSVPYLDKGRDLSGWDCYGLYQWMLRERHGICIPSYTDDYTSAEAKDVASALTHRADALWAAVPAGSERRGDGVVFLIGGEPLHCGYVIEPGIMLHSLRGRGTCIERYSAPQWVKRLEGFYRWNS